MKLQLSQARHWLCELVSHWPLPPASSRLPSSLPLSFFPSFPPSLPSSEHSTLTSSWVAEFPAFPHGVLFPQTFQRHKNDHFVGGTLERKEAWSQLPVGHHPVTAHQNLKIQISESELSPTSSPVLAYGNGTAVCPGALPDPWTCAPHSLATSPHPDNLGTNHIPSSLIAAGGAKPGTPPDRTVPLHTALTPLFLSVKPPTSLHCLPQEPRRRSSVRRCCTPWLRVSVFGAGPPIVHAGPPGFSQKCCTFLHLRGLCRPESAVPKAHSSHLP